METFSHTLQVRFRDMDAYGHVNNSVYFTYLEEARTAFVQHLQLEPVEHIVMVVSYAELHYRGQATCGEQVTITLWVSEMKGSYCELRYKLTKPSAENIQDNQEPVLLVEATTRHVCFNQKLQSAVRYPASWRKKVLESLGSSALL